MAITYKNIQIAINGLPTSLQARKNLHTALANWLNCHSLDDGHHPERLLAAEFDVALQQYRNYLAGQQLGRGTIADRVTLIRRIRRLYFDLRVDIAAPNEFVSALREAIDEAALSQKALAKSIGISDQALGDWANGSQTPSRRNVPLISKLETLLRLPDGHLTKRLGHCYGDAPEGAGSCLTPHRRKLSRLRSQPFQLGEAAITEDLRQEWMSLLHFKTELLGPGTRRSTSWRVKDVSRVPESYGWWATLGKNVCVSAALNFKRAMGLLGFAILDASKGGKGLSPDSVLTLATCADGALVRDHLEFLRARAGAFNGEADSVLRFIRSLVRPQFGFLWQHTEYGKKFWRGPLEGDAWKLQCEETYFYLGEILKHLVSTGQLEKTRNPIEPIQVIIDKQKPIQALMQFVERVERAAPPATWRRRRAAYMRDVLLIKMLISNPLRAHHFAIMTYREDNTGNLFQKSDGSWWLRFRASDFKNQAGAARDEYEVRLAHWVWNDIESYLRKYRSLLAFEGNDFVFRPKVSSKKDAKNVSMMHPRELSKGIRALTHRHIKNCPGFGAHAFRHIIATDFIKNHPQSFLIAATILHDRIETVMKNYAHLKKADEFETYNSYLQGLQETRASEP